MYELADYSRWDGENLPHRQPTQLFRGHSYPEVVYRREGTIGLGP